MTKKKTTAPAYLTREILKEEISASEQRLDAKIDGVEKRLDTKIDASTQSMKDYTDSRFNRSDAKMTKYFELMMQMITGFQKEIKNILTNHACVPKRLCAVQGF